MEGHRVGSECTQFRMLDNSLPDPLYPQDGRGSNRHRATSHESRGATQNPLHISTQPPTCTHAAIPPPPDRPVTRGGTVRARPAPRRAPAPPAPWRCPLARPAATTARRGGRAGGCCRSAAAAAAASTAPPRAGATAPAAGGCRAAPRRAAARRRRRAGPAAPPHTGAPARLPAPPPVSRRRRAWWRRR